MSSELEPALGQSPCPPLTGADAAGVVQQPLRFFLPGQPREFPVQGVVRMQECFLSAQRLATGSLSGSTGY
jgi:hypothetical protein